MQMQCYVWETVTPDDVICGTSGVEQLGVKYFTAIDTKAPDVSVIKYSFSLLSRHNIAVATFLNSFANVLSW
jgi:hypothetical protein